MARVSGQVKSHTATVKFTTPDDINLFERVSAAASSARRDVSDEIIMALEKQYPATETPAEG